MAKRIHIIDDDRDIISAIETILSMEGYEVSYSYTGGDGVTAIGQTLPDLVLLDYMLPDMTGKQVSERIKSEPHLRHIPIILISAAHGVQDKAKSMHIQGCVEKPFDIDTLLSVIAEKLGETKNTPH